MNDMRNYLMAGMILLASWPGIGRAQNLLSAPPAVQEEVGMTNEQNRLGYALGYIFGTGMKHEKFEIDLAIVARGMKDGWANEMAVTNPLATQKEARAVLFDYRKAEEARELAAQLEVARTNEEKGMAFCETNAYREGVTTLPSGLQFRVLKQGDGPVADTNLIITTVWRGTSIDGREFHDTRKNSLGSEYRFWNQFVIRGLAEALPMMRVGDRWEIVIPSHLAYGKAGYIDGIKPGETLIYDLEVLSVQQRVKEVAAGERRPPVGSREHGGAWQNGIDGGIVTVW